MKKSLLFVLIGSIIALNPVAAQSNTLGLDCGSSDSSALNPGEETTCYVEKFSSNFNWSQYNQDWTVSQGEILQESVESVQIKAPLNYSNNELVVKGVITDGSKRNYTAEKSLTLEPSQTSNESNRNSSYETPVEQPVNNSTDQDAKLPDFSLECGENLKTGSEVTCKVNYMSNNSVESHKWTVKGPGEVRGDKSEAVYTAPKDLGEVQNVEVKLTVFSSSENVSDSAKIRVKPVQVQENQTEENDNRELQRYKQKIDQQKKTIENYRSTIKDLRNRVSELEKRLENNGENPPRQTTRENPGEGDSQSEYNQQGDRDSQTERSDSEYETESIDSEQSSESVEGREEENRTAQNTENEENPSKQNKSLLEKLASLFS